MKISKRQIAGMNICYGFFSFDYFLNSMQRLGLHSIEVHGAAPHLYFPDLTAGEIQSIGKNIIAHNLEVICFTPEQCKYPVNIAKSVPAFTAGTLFASYPGLQAFSSIASLPANTAPSSTPKPPPAPWRRRCVRFAAGSDPVTRSSLLLGMLALIQIRHSSFCKRLSAIISSELIYA